jgi:putative redox protein
MAGETVARARLGAGMHFDVQTASGFSLTMDADPVIGRQAAGPGPMEVMLAALAGCVGITVISLVRKQRQDVTGYELRLTGRQAEQHPHVFTAITIEHHVTGHGLSRGAISRAVELAEQRYCPVSTTLATLARITHTIEVHEVPAEPGQTQEA